jgi:hypothetical protein
MITEQEKLLVKLKYPKMDMFDINEYAWMYKEFEDITKITFIDYIGIFDNAACKEIETLTK